MLPLDNPPAGLTWKLQLRTVFLNSENLSPFDTLINIRLRIVSSIFAFLFRILEIFGLRVDEYCYLLNIEISNNKNNVRSKTNFVSERLENPEILTLQFFSLGLSYVLLKNT